MILILQQASFPFNTYLHLQTTPCDFRMLRDCHFDKSNKDSCE
jgi:hypothetical protein